MMLENKRFNIDILRHGETTLSHTLRGSTDDALTLLGWQQMRNTMLQALDAGQKWDVIFTSPLQRCDLFAREFAEQQHLSVIVNENLQEMHFGDWDGQSTEKIYQDTPELLANFWQYPTKFSAPNGENLLVFQQRIDLAMQQMTQQMQKQQWKSALVISHGGVIKLLKCQALQKPLDDLLKMSAELGELHVFQWDDAHLKIRARDVSPYQGSSV